MVLKSISCQVQLCSQTPFSINIPTIDKENGLSSIKDIQAQINAYLTDNINSSPTSTETPEDFAKESDEEYEESE